MTLLGGSLVVGRVEGMILRFESGKVLTNGYPRVVMWTTYTFLKPRFW